MNTSHADQASGLGVRNEYRLLFAYGSNMNPAQMQARCGAVPRILGIARLPGHRVAFYGHSKKWDGGQETVDREPSGEVWGVVYEVPLGDAEKLDAFQDARLDGAGAYFHYPVEVITAEGKRLAVMLYKKDQVEERHEPSREYLVFILQGAEENGLPAGYLAELRAIPSHPAQYEVPRTSKYERLMGEGCATCGDLRASKGGPGLRAAASEA